MKVVMRRFPRDHFLNSRAWIVFRFSGSMVMMNCLPRRGRVMVLALTSRNLLRAASRSLLSL